MQNLEEKEITNLKKKTCILKLKMRNLIKTLKSLMLNIKNIVLI